jgi:hypothetical protein
MSNFYSEKKIIKKVFNFETLILHINSYLSVNDIGSGELSRRVTCIQIDEWDEDNDYQAHLCIMLEYTDEDEDDYDFKKINNNLPICSNLDLFLSNLSKEIGIDVALPFDYRSK